MQNEPENEPVEEQDHPFTSRITGLGQKILGEIEELAGVINADPLAQEEGEFNVEVGTVRDELEDEVEESDQR
jgi:hypothetical protein